MTSRFGPFSLDEAQRQLTRDGASVHLTPKAFDLLLLLIEQAPRVVHKRELHERLWRGTFVSDATLVGLIKELRRALGDAGSRSPMIRTAHRVGYAFGAPIARPLSLAPAISRWIVVGAQRIPIVADETLIGRDPSSAIRLDAGGVSRRHARILVVGADAVIEDLGSKNGTIVRGRLLDARVVLADGDAIVVGPVTIVYRSSSDGMPTETLTPRR